MKRFLRFLPFMVLALSAACSDDPATPPASGPSAPFHLSADKTDISVGETVTFTVTSSEGTDVTSKCTFCSQTACYTGNTHTFQEADVYVIEAHYQANDPEHPEGIATENKVTINVGGIEPTAPFRLSADKTEIEVGETVTFTVTSANGLDVTDRSTVCSQTACYSGNTHTFQEEGVFVIEGHYQDNNPEHPGGIATENKVTVTVGEAVAGYTVSADKTSIERGETVTFSMTAADGSDVTTDTHFLVKDKQIEGNTYTFTEAGIHAIRALYMGDPTQPEGIEAKNKLAINVLKGAPVYTLEVDRTQSKVREPVVFNVVTNDGENVNGKFSIAEVDGETYPYHTRMYMKAGTYTLCAVSRDDPAVKSVNTVTVTVTDKSTDVDRNRFYRRSILAELTGTWCGQCPYLARQIDFMQENLLYDRAVVVAVHDPTTPSQQGSLGNQFILLSEKYHGIFWGQIPAYTIDWNSDYTTQSWSSNPETNGPNTAAFITSSQALDPLTAGISASSTLSGRKLSLTVNITSKQTTDYYIGAALVEDNIVGYQSSGGDNYVHMNVGQGMITDSGKIAEPIGSISDGQEKTLNYTYDIPTSSQSHAVDPANCRVVIWVCKASSSANAAFGYLCSNAISCPVGGSVEYQYEPVE